MFFGIFEKRSANDFQRPNLRDPKTWSDLAGHSTISHSGEGVNEVNAMEITAFSSALNAVADAFCQLPIHIEKTRAGKTSRDNESHEASFVRDGGTINEDGTTAVDWLKGLILHYYTKGRASTLIERAQNDAILNLWPLDPDKLAVKVRSVKTDTGLTREQRYFAYTDPNGVVHEYDVRNVIDLVRLPDPVTLRPSPVVMNRHTIGLAIAAEKYAARTFKSGMVPMQLVCTLPPEAITGPQIEQAWMTAIEGLRRAAESGAQFFCNVPGFELKEIGVRPGDLQLLELRKFLIVEIARVFNLPPVFLQDLSTGTFSNTEQQARVLVQNTLMPIIRQFEAQMNAKFVGKQQTLRVNVDGFLRADYSTRMEGHRTGVQGGFLTPNEARALEGREPLEGGDQLFVQQATVPLSMASDLASATIKKANEPAPAPVAPITPNEPVEPAEEDAQ